MTLYVRKNDKVFRQLDAVLKSLQMKIKFNFVFKNSSFSLVGTINTKLTDRKYFLRICLEKNTMLQCLLIQFQAGQVGRCTSSLTNTTTSLATPITLTIFNFISVCYTRLQE